MGPPALGRCWAPDCHSLLTWAASRSYRHAATYRMTFDMSDKRLPTLSIPSACHEHAEAPVRKYMSTPDGKYGSVENRTSEPRKVRKTIAAATIGTALEWYDFYIYGTAAALVFPKLFFPNSSPQMALIASFATFGVGFFARPVGAAIFGHVTDRFGRKLTLMLTMVLMGGASVTIGFLPTYDAIGILAPVLLVLLRLLQGIGVGGEWGGAVLISMEQDVDGKRRGFFASWTGLGAPLGAVISTGVVLGVSAAFGDDFDGSSLTAGWRWPFYASVFLVAVGIFIRLGIEESPEFVDTKHKGQTSKRPVWDALTQHPRAVLIAAMMRASENGPYYIFAAFILSYGVTELGQDRDVLLLAVTAAAALTLVTVPLSGHFSDKFGRKRVMYVGIAATAVWSLCYFGLLGTGNASVIFIVVTVSLLPWSFQYGPQPAFIAESFPTNVRASGAGLGYQIGGAIWGGLAPLIAAALLPLGVWAVSLYLLVLCVISTLALQFLPDRTGMPLTDDEFTGRSFDFAQRAALGSDVR